MLQAQGLVHVDLEGAGGRQGLHRCRRLQARIYQQEIDTTRAISKRYT